MQLYPDFDGSRGQPLAGPQIPGHAAPAPGIDEQARRTEGLDIRVGRHIRLLPIAVVLPAYQGVGRQRLHGPKHAGLGAVDGRETLEGRRLHRQQGDDLEQMILDHVTQATGAFIEAAALADPECFGQRHLHTRDVVAVPDRLEKRIGEAEVQDVHDRILAEVMIDAKNRVFREHRAGDGVEFASGCQIASEGLFDDDAGVLGQAGGTEAADHGGKQRRRNRQVVGGAFGGAQRLLQRVERARIGIVAGDIVEQRQQPIECGFVVDGGVAAPRWRAHGDAIRRCPRASEATPITGTVSTPFLTIA